MKKTISIPKDLNILHNMIGQWGIERIQIETWAMIQECFEEVSQVLIFQSAVFL